MKSFLLLILKTNKLKLLGSTLLLILVLTSCSQDNKVEQKNLTVVQQYIDAVESLDYRTMESFLDENYMGYGPSYGDSINKTDAVASWKKSAETLYESIKYNKSRNIAVTVPDGENKGDWVSNWAELNITYKDNLGEVNLWANTVYKIENGKIVKTLTFYNEADALEQLGYVFIDVDNL
ncbi:MAG: hypothetical protein P8X62_08215 [Flavobacteriaceae bacterium]